MLTKITLIILYVLHHRVISPDYMAIALQSFINFWRSFRLFNFLSPIYCHLQKLDDFKQRKFESDITMLSNKWTQTPLCISEIKIM